MSSADWAELDNVLAAGTVLRGATGGITPPSGGGSAVYVMNSVDGTVTGAVGLYCLIADFSPLAKGGSISGCIKKLSSSGNTGFSPFLFIGASGHDVSDTAYLLGLENADPYRVVLRKTGTAGILGGIPEAASGEYLRRSSGQEQISDDEYRHLKVDMILEPTNDIVLQVFENDLSANPLGSAPDWQPIAGMTQFVDDVAGINSGSAPYLSGYAGFACSWAEAIGRRCAFDHVVIERQT